MDTNTIRTRLDKLGWNIKEIPVRKSNPDPDLRQISSWKLIAFKGERSIEVAGKTFDKAMETLGETLGVIPRNG